MRRSIAFLALLAPALASAAASSVLDGKHNLSASGPGPVRAVSEQRACIFCHVAHGKNGRTDNRPQGNAAVRRYASSTMKSAQPGLLQGSSRTCLSCHDGTIAMGQTLASGNIALVGAAPGGLMKPGRGNFGGDLSGTHPVSFRPSASAAVRTPHPDDEVKLDKHGMVQCTSCHDPHSEDNDPVEKKFLVKSNQGSAICRSCHALNEWASSAHQTSFANTAALAVTQSGVPRTVGEMGCGGCHQNHGAGGQRLLKGERNEGEDRVCLDCHNGRVAKLDVAREVAKPFAHAAPPAGPSGHDAAEGPDSPTNRLPEIRPSAQRHASCVDCHDPHAAQKISATAPRAPGSLFGVWGIDRNGMKVDPVSYEYEVCFKCHGDSANQPRARGAGADGPRRAVVDVNLRRVFDVSAASAHPVEQPGRNADVPSLLAPLSPGSVVYCSDCHGSDASTATNVPRGPHGSVHPKLLQRAFATQDRTPESPAAYALCYKCHDRNVLLSDRSAFRLHDRHVRGSSTPCSVCHNPHGVSALAGNPVNNAHLVDFDVNVVRTNATGLRQYASRGARSGTCNLNCHGVEHADRSY